jgi:NAD(P)-dependent dehydrogenase (short-subunit alcohol dehydrogenase family)
MSSPVVLITGASSGIGLATAQLLAERGYTVIGGSRRQPDVSGFTLLPLDVRDDESVARWVQAALDRMGRIDALVNNAGHSLGGAVEEATAEDARRLFETNFFGVIRVTNAVLPVMRAQGSGRVVNIGSLAGQLGVPYLGLYGASKFALEGYTESLRYEVRRFGIHVSLVEPGDIRTDIVALPASRAIPAYNGERETVTAIHTANVRNGPPPADVARVVARVLADQRPRLRYRAGREWYVPLARRLVPPGLLEWAVRKAYNL